MTGLFLGLLACGAPPAPPDLAAELSSMHEVPPVARLQSRYPRLLEQLEAIAQASNASPLVVERAWTLIAELPDDRAGDLASEVAGSLGLPPAVRYKVLQRLVRSHPERAAAAAVSVACDPSSLVRLGARTARRNLELQGHTVGVFECDEMR